MQPIGPSVQIINHVISPPSNVSRKDQVGNYLKKIASLHPPLLKILLNKFPKGGLLHAHLSGSVLAKDLLKFAIDARLFLNECTRFFTTRPQPCDIAAAALPIKYSILGFHSTSEIIEAELNSFDTKESILCHTPPEKILQYMIKRLEAQNIDYAEIMTSPYLAKKLALEIRNSHEKFPVKLIVEVGRSHEKMGTFTEDIEYAFTLVKKYPEIVGINLVGYEEEFSAIIHFHKQMETIDRLWKKYGKPHIALHAGGISIFRSNVNAFTDRISRSISQGHAERIGHGLTINFEEDAVKVLQEMKTRKIAVEVCFSTEKRLYGLYSDYHPAKLYELSGVPVTLGSDDPVINRADLTDQFFIAFTEQDFDYRQLKTFARNSLEFSFLDGESIYKNRDTGHLRASFAGIQNDEWTPDSEAQNIIARSEKARLQVQLERKLAAFEKEIICDYIYS